MSAVNHQFRLAARPVGLPKRSDWSLTEEPAPEPSDGEFLVKILYISLDPAMRGWMNEGRSYIAPVGIGEVMRAGAVGRVIGSKHPGFAVGDHVYGRFGVQEYAVSKGDGVTKVDPTQAPLPVFLGALGLPGMTAYFGLLDIGKPQDGQTVVVSGAAGAVGMVVGQIARVHGCRVVGIAGGPEKCRYLVTELGFDAAIDYKTEDVRKALRQHCPKGIDVYFDNVGGDILDAALANLARHARIVICGAISQYNNTTPVKGPSNYLSLLVNRASMTGMVVFDYADRYHEATSAIAGWLAAGKLKSREDIVAGFATFPETLLKLFAGENFGKLVLAKHVLPASRGAAGERLAPPGLFCSGAPPVATVRDPRSATLTGFLLSIAIAASSKQEASAVWSRRESGVTGDRIRVVQSPNERARQAPVDEGEAERDQRESGELPRHQPLMQKERPENDRRRKGRAPRKAVKTAKGRKKVIAWLKMLENQSAQQRPEDPMGAYDFTWLWRELGVGDERR